MRWLFHTLEFYIYIYKPISKSFYPLLAALHYNLHFFEASKLPNPLTRQDKHLPRFSEPSSSLPSEFSLQFSNLHYFFETSLKISPVFISIFFPFSSYAAICGNK